jgi:hypothetical protein
MMNKFKNKTAVAIITCNREDYFKRAFKSIDPEAVSRIYVVNNGAPYKEYPDNSIILQSKRNPTVVGIGKNSALREMKKAGYDYLFLMEDDIIIKDNKVFEKYILTAADSGLWAGQLSYGLHGGVGGGNVTAEGAPIKKATIQYDKHKVDLYRNSFAAFTLYHAKTLDHLGYMDERYLNSAEHLDHYFRAFIKNLGNHYWYFPDIENSFEYIEDIDTNHEGSCIRKNPTFAADFSYSWQLFKEKFGVFPHEVKDVEPEVMLDKLALIERHHARKDLLKID